MKRYLLAVALLGAATPSAAADWWLVSQARDFAGFVDAQSIETSWDGEPKAVIRRVEYRPGPNGEKSHLVRARFDCRRNIMTIVSTRTFDAFGDEIGHYDASRPEQEPERVGRGSAGRAELDFVCDKRSKTRRFAQRADTDLQEAADKADRLHRRLGLTYSDAFSLTLRDPRDPGLRDLVADLVPRSREDEALRILGLDDWNQDWRSGE